MEIALQRLAQQRLAGSTFSGPEQAVAWLGAVQSQEYPGGKWALGLRVPGATDAGLDQTFNAGAILRTHVLRPTWHFVTPADIRWMLELTAPRVHLRNAPYARGLAIDAALFLKSEPVMLRALEEQPFLTRAELGQALDRASIPASDLRLTLLVMHAELEGLLCSGPRRGKQFTYALLSERAPQAASLPHDQALSELARRYFCGHGPATLKDFGWWSGLTLAEARAGLNLAGAALDTLQVEGQQYWFDAAMPPARGPLPDIYLLPTYDEYWVGYQGFGRSRLGAEGAETGSPTDAAMLCAGRVLGSWRRTLEKGAVRIAFHPFQPFDPAGRAAAEAAARRYGEFLGLPVKFLS